MIRWTEIYPQCPRKGIVSSEGLSYCPNPLPHTESNHSIMLPAKSASQTQVNCMEGRQPYICATKSASQVFYRIWLTILPFQYAASPVYDQIRLAIPLPPLLNSTVFPRLQTIVICLGHVMSHKCNFQTKSPGIYVKTALLT